MREAVRLPRDQRPRNQAACELAPYRRSKVRYKLLRAGWTTEAIPAERYACHSGR
jgi:hypothetical protein